MISKTSYHLSFYAIIYKAVACLIFFIAINAATQAQRLDFAVDQQKDELGVYNLKFPLPEGVYRVRLVLGSDEAPGHTVVRAESRRFFA